MRSRHKPKRCMKPTKTLNIKISLHKRLKAASVAADEPLGSYVEAVLEVGLARPRDVAKQLLAGDTSEEAKPVKG